VVWACTSMDKFVVVDFNGANPTVFTGSSNLAAGGEQANGDSLAMIEDAAVANMFAIEAVALFDHYHFRKVMQPVTVKEPPLTLWYSGQAERAQSVVESLLRSQTDPDARPLSVLRPAAAARPCRDQERRLVGDRRRRPTQEDVLPRRPEIRVLERHLPERRRLPARQTAAEKPSVEEISQETGQETGQETD